MCCPGVVLLTAAAAAAVGAVRQPHDALAEGLAFISSNGA
jgi:hypothetical protein